MCSNVDKMCSNVDKMCRNVDKMCRNVDKMCRNVDKMCTRTVPQKTIFGHNSLKGAKKNFPGNLEFFSSGAI